MTTSGITLQIIFRQASKLSVITLRFFLNTFFSFSSATTSSFCNMLKWYFDIRYNINLVRIRWNENNIIAVWSGHFVFQTGKSHRSLFHNDIWKRSNLTSSFATFRYWNMDFQMSQNKICETIIYFISMDFQVSQLLLLLSRYSMQLNTAWIPVEFCQPSSRHMDRLLKFLARKVLFAVFRTHNPTLLQFDSDRFIRRKQQHHNIFTV